MTSGFRQWLDGFLSVAIKEVRHIRRDGASLVFAMLIPTVQIILFGFAIDFDVRHVDTVIVDMDRSRESRAYVEGLRSTQYLEIIARKDDSQDALEMMRRGSARVAVVIPPNFSRAAHPSVQILVDGSDSQVATRVVSALRPPSTTELGESSRPPATNEPRHALRPPADTHIELLYNPDARTSRFTIPGLIGVILQLVTVSLTSLSLVREREQGTLEQVMVSPLSRMSLMLGKIVPYFCLALVEMTLVLALARLVFDVRCEGSYVALYFMTLPFLLASLALGLVISTVAQNQGQAVQLTLLTLLPSILLSGFVFPRESMPGPLYVLSCAIPVTYYVQILRGVIIRGAGLAELWSQTLVLWGIATLLISVAVSRFRKSLQ